MGVKIAPSGDGELLPSGVVPIAIDCVIPLVGARVLVTSGKKVSAPGVVTDVVDGTLKLRMMDPEEVGTFVRAMRAKYGSDWMASYYEATVLFDDETTGKFLRAEVEVVGTGMIRPKWYRTL
jgi:hypothetical protein